MLDRGGCVLSARNDLGGSSDQEGGEAGAPGASPLWKGFPLEERLQPNLRCGARTVSGGR